ncbi:MAG: MBL fold metallo-hydrolase [Propionibacteriaceae bacterium]
MTHRTVLAPNAGPMTLDGTNTWLVGDPDGRWVVIDPGPPDEEHLAAVLAAGDHSIQEVLLTHHHDDHSAAVARLAELADCPVRAADPRFRIGTPGLSDGDVIMVGEVRLTAVASPGHTADSYSFLMTDQGTTRLLTGDTVLGRGTTVIAAPDGDLGDYFDTLAKLADLVRAHDVMDILPGHGPLVEDPAERLEAYRRHRLERLDQVRAALVAGARTTAEVVEVVYADVDRSVWPAAEQSVRAQLTYLGHTPD